MVTRSVSVIGIASANDDDATRSLSCGNAVCSGSCNVGYATPSVKSSECAAAMKSVGNDDTTNMNSVLALESSSSSRVDDGPKYNIDDRDKSVYFVDDSSR